LFRPTVATPSFGRSRIGLVNPVAAITSSTSKTSSVAQPRRRDHVVDLEDELGRAVGLPRVNDERLAGPLDALDRRVEHDDPTREDVVLVRLHVSGADSDERSGVDRELRRGR